MTVNNTRNEEQLSDVESSSVDSFIKELEEKEKDLDISSDLVIEVDESDVGHDNIHDSFISTEPPEVEKMQPPESANGKAEMELQSRLSKVEDERSQLKDSLIRMKRDFDNYRKRTKRERKETFTSVVCNVAAETLPVIDNMNRALDSVSLADGNVTEKDFQTFLDGIVLVSQQLSEVLTSMGVQPIPAVGEPFDPNFHEAVETEETDQFPPKTVISEILTGYKVDDRVIRASMVSVSSAKKSEEKAD